MILLILWLFALVRAPLCYYYLKFNYNYWRDRRVPHPNPELIFGNAKDVILLKATIGEWLQQIYKRYEGHPFVGIYELRTPALLLRDPELIKRILIKDFSHFQGRGIVMNENADPLCVNLINLSGSRWRVLRTKLTPVFTAVKIRNMFDLIAESSRKFKNFVERYADKEETVEFRDLAAKFTSEAIGTCCFGIQTNSIQDEDSEFRIMCRKVLDPCLVIALKRLVRVYLPGIFNSLKISLNPPDVTKYFINVVGDVIKHRKANDVIRHDFMDTLMQIRNEAMGLNDDEIAVVNVIDDNVVAAQAYIFFLAGFETSSTAMSFAMYELATNPHIQNKLVNEIKSALKKHDRFCYEAITEMEYLDRVIHETLRKYPPVGMVPRICNTSYTIPDTDIVIEKGVRVLVPIYAIHHDPVHYPAPTKFDPDRFLEENKKLRGNCTFLPFGDRPRVCIGTRFAYAQTKAGLVALLTDYEVLLDPRTTSPQEYDPMANILNSKSGIWLKLRRRRELVASGKP